jgi:Family of unknown function (DUF5946)
VNVASAICTGCGALVPAAGIAPDHAYIDASPGCWSIFTDLRGREASDPRYLAHGRSITDAYMVQHPGVPGRQSSQSVWVHLVALHAVIELGLTPSGAIDLMRHVLAGRPSFSWLDPPGSPGPTTVVDVAAARDPDEYCAVVRQWASDAWRAWAPHHEAIRRLASTGLREARGGGHH